MSASALDTRSVKAEGRREQKKRATRERIAETGMNLFIANGYEATTLDAIAAAAGISRRTFFYYFKSKDDILLSIQTDGADAVIAAVMEQPPDCPPLDMVRNALVEVCAHYQPDAMVVIDRLMLSSPTLLARKQANYIVQEQGLFAALAERWPDPERVTALRIVAMLSIGAMRLSIDAWRAEGGKRPVSELVVEIFETLKAEV